MEIEKGKTFRYLREKREVSQAAKDNQKQFMKIKKAILDALQGGELTIAELSEKLNIKKHEIVFYLMSLIKYGFVETGEIDDMDEYFTYKIRK
jgi:DNA-directed RNA polymerase specialized sigma subunit